MMNYLYCLLGLHISFHIDSFINTSFTPINYLSKSDFHRKALVKYSGQGSARIQVVSSLKLGSTRKSYRIHSYIRKLVSGLFYF